MVISSFISSILVLTLGIWAYLRLESSMNIFAEKQLLIEPSKFSFKMWKDMPVSMYQSFTFFNLTNWNQVKSVGQKPRFVEVGPYVYKTIWSKSDVNFQDEDRLVSFSERKQWHFQAHLSRGHEEDMIWTINTPLMTALALIQNAPVITRNIVSVILDGLGEGAFIKRPIRSLLFDGYADLIVSVGPLFDRRFANFNGKFAYLYNKNDTVDGHWTVSTGQDDLATLNKITRFQSSIVNMTSFSSGQMPQGLNEVKAECAPAWSLDQSTNGQLFAPFNLDAEQTKLQKQLQQIKARTLSRQQDEQQQQQQASTGSRTAISQQLAAISSRPSESIVQAPKRFFSRISSSVSSSSSPSSLPGNQIDTHHHQQSQMQEKLQQQQQRHQHQHQQQLRDTGKYIFYPDLCRPIHLLPAKQQVTSDNGIQASRYFIDPRVFMNSSQMATNKCYEMNPRPPLANALAATLNSVTGANMNVPSLVTSASSPFALFTPPNSINHNNNNFHHHHNHQPQQHLQHHHHHENGGGLFERANNPNSFLNNALHSLSVTANQAADQLASPTSNSAISRLGRVRQLFTNIVSQRMSANPLLPSLTAGPAGLLTGINNHHHAASLLTARNASPEQMTPISSLLSRQNRPLEAPVNLEQVGSSSSLSSLASNNLETNQPDAVAQQQHQTSGGLEPSAIQPGLSAQLSTGPITPTGGSDRWITQFRFKWPRGVFSIGQCQLGAPIYVSLPHFLDADEYYLEQVDGLKPNRSLHEFYIDVESTLHSVPVSAKARLQLNVATPELRFRNIPNAMIPVLWQEVTFKIDKPVATMLYWSFTMSSTIYKIISVALICGGVVLLIFSFVGGFKTRACHSRQAANISRGRNSYETDGSSRTRLDHDQRDQVSFASGSHLSDIIANQAGSPPQPRLNGENQIDAHTIYEQRLAGREQPRSGLVRQQQEGRRSSWQHMILQRPAKHCSIHHDGSGVSSQNQHEPTNCNNLNIDSLTELHHGASINQAFAVSCNEIHLDRHGSDTLPGPASSGESVNTNNNSLSPKQPTWSRASSHCELMSSFGTITKGVNGSNCTGCLFACLRHSPNGGGCHVGGTHNESLMTSGTRDINNQVVRQHQQQPNMATTSDIDKTTLSSSRSSNLDSCSSIYTTKKCRKFV